MDLYTIILFILIGMAGVELLNIIFKNDKKSFGKHIGSYSLY